MKLLLDLFCFFYVFHRFHSHNSNRFYRFCRGFSCHFDVVKWHTLLLLQTELVLNVVNKFRFTKYSRVFLFILSPQTVWMAPYFRELSFVCRRRIAELFKYYGKHQSFCDIKQLCEWVPVILEKALNRECIEHHRSQDAIII